MTAAHHQLPTSVSPLCQPCQPGSPNPGSRVEGGGHAHHPDGGGTTSGRPTPITRARGVSRAWSRTISRPVFEPMSRTVSRPMSRSVSRSVSRSLAPLVTLVALAVALLAGLVASAVPAMAQGPTPSPSTTVPTDARSWALTPTGEPGEPGSRPDLSYQLDPGAELDDSVTLWNSSTRPTTFRVYATDAFTTREGGFDLLPGGVPATGAGSWIRLAVPDITVEPGKKVDIPVHLSVPRVASPGDHAAGVVATTQVATTDPDGNVVTVEHRVGSRVYVRVSGTVVPTLVVDAISVSYRGTANPVGRGEADVRYTIRNAGNVRLRGTQHVSLSGVGGLGRIDRDLGPLPELLPGATISHEVHVDEVLPAIRLTAAIEIVPVPPTGVGDGAVEPARATATAWAVPWTLLAVLVVAATALGWWLRRWRRARRSSVGGPEGEAATPDVQDGGDDDASADDRGRGRRVGATVGASALLLVLATAALGVVLVAVPGFVGPATAQAGTVSVERVVDGPFLALGDAVAVDADLVIALGGWQQGPVEVAVCGNAARRGSADCNLTGTRGVKVGPSSFARVVVAATPPVACPCVVRATARAGADVSTAPLTILFPPGAEPPTAPSVPAPPTTTAVPPPVAESAPGLAPALVAGGAGLVLFVVVLLAVVVRVRRRRAEDLAADPTVDPADDPTPTPAGAVVAEPSPPAEAATADPAPSPLPVGAP